MFCSLGTGCLTKLKSMREFTKHERYFLVGLIVLVLLHGSSPLPAQQQPNPKCATCFWRARNGTNMARSSGVRKRPWIPRRPSCSFTARNNGFRKLRPDQISRARVPRVKLRYPAGKETPEAPSRVAMDRFWPRSTGLISARLATREPYVPHLEVPP